MSLISVRQMSKDLVLPGAPPAPILKDLTFDIEVGEFVAITGPSGSGKSTLLYLLGGLDHPTRGELLFDGEDLSKMSDDELTRKRNRQIGFVYQFHYLLPEFSALENVMMPLLASEAMNRKEAIARAKEVLTAVGLEDRLHHLPKQLSGGQQQRVSIARALSNQPSVLFGDEPTGNLDTVNTQAVYELLRDLNRRTGQTIVIVTHDDEIAAKADRQIQVVDGVIAFDRRRAEANLR
ncbi:Lipoprotein-releasing system ATP-binding protein LolD [compost metagenome]